MPNVVVSRGIFSNFMVKEKRAVKNDTLFLPNIGGSARSEYQNNPMFLALFFVSCDYTRSNEQGRI